MALVCGLLSSLLLTDGYLNSVIAYRQFVNCLKSHNVFRLSAFLHFIVNLSNIASTLILSRQDDEFGGIPQSHSGYGFPDTNFVFPCPYFLCIVSRDDHRLGFRVRLMPIVSENSDLFEWKELGSTKKTMSTSPLLFAYVGYGSTGL